MEDLKKLKSDLEVCLKTVNRLLGGEAPSIAYGAMKKEEGIHVSEKEMRDGTTMQVVEIVDKDRFIETCNMLAVHPHADEKQAEGLRGLGSLINKYGSISMGKLRFFKAVHFALMGTWPEFGGKAAPAPVTTMTQEELDSIPF